MQTEIKVSVIIPVYQVEEYLERAVDSVLQQTLEEKEIILVDDGSEDASPAICDRYAREYPELVRVIHKENEGLGMARNTGVEAAAGEYVAFLDSDDTVEPEMYETLYRKAKEADYDIVMCDVKIVYVEEGRSSVVSTYTGEPVDLADYLLHGNNITYSVNKLYRRSIWQENRYEKMLFEDIALIPALITRYPHIGYVPQPFYLYYRRANTISTTLKGQMVDLVQAFRDFLDRSDPRYREEVVYNAAKQLYWNMLQSRVLFQADFIELLREYEADFRLNPYIEKDGKIRNLLEFLDHPVIPERFILLPDTGRTGQEGAERLADFPRARCVQADVTCLPPDSLPETVRQALCEGRELFAAEYAALRLLHEGGGIVLGPDSYPSLQLKKLRLNRVFFGFEDSEELTAGCFGALPGHYVIRALLDSYERDSIFNRAFLPLKDRLCDLLVLHFGLKVNGRSQLLKKEVQVYLPSVLAYDMQDGENCCKQVVAPVPEGYELVSDKVLKLWSDRLLENWNLYKKERNTKHPTPAKAAPPPPAGALPDTVQREIDRRVQEVVDTYEQSTSWKITRPLRALMNLFRRRRKTR